jgi:hypothetical protein
VALVSAAAGLEQPNVIVINCDDLGYGDLGCYGASDIRTPLLDEIAAQHPEVVARLSDLAARTRQETHVPIDGAEPQ